MESHKQMSVQAMAAMLLGNLTFWSAIGFGAAEIVAPASL
jgi:hypothetical protein